MRITTSPLVAVNTKEESFFKELGARLAQARKQQGITQVQLSATLGIAQQTLAHYEGGRLRLPTLACCPSWPRCSKCPSKTCSASSLRTPQHGQARGHRPASNSRLSKSPSCPARKRRFVIEMLDTTPVLAQAQR